MTFETEARDRRGPVSDLSSFIVISSPLVRFCFESFLCLSVNKIPVIIADNEEDDDDESGFY